MKFFNLFTLFFVAIAIHCATAKKEGEIALPSIINETDKGGFALMITTKEKVNSSNGAVSYVNKDIELKNCVYDINLKKIKCEFKNNNETYHFVASGKIENSCNLTNNTTFSYLDLYSVDLDNKVEQTNYVAYFEKTQCGMINIINYVPKRFQFLTNDNCQFVILANSAFLRTSVVNVYNSN